MVNDSRKLLENWRKFQKKTLEENTESNENQLTPQEIQGEQVEFKKAIGGVVTFNTITKTGNNFLFMRGQIKSGENILSFSFKMDECVISTQNLALTDESVQLIGQLYAYHKAWVQKWQQNLT